MSFPKSVHRRLADGPRHRETLTFSASEYAEDIPEVRAKFPGYSDAGALREAVHAFAQQVKAERNLRDRTILPTGEQEPKKTAFERGDYSRLREAVMIANPGQVVIAKGKLAELVGPHLGGRYRARGSFSGEAFREDSLLPLFLGGKADVVELDLDGILGPTPSFFEEAFGGLVRAFGPHGAEVQWRIRLVASPENQHLVAQIKGYIDEAVAALPAKDETP